MIGVEDIVFDRGHALHAINLWNIEGNYADDIPSHPVIAQMEKTSPELSPPREL
jgi:hypothetical protein